MPNLFSRYRSATAPFNFSSKCASLCFTRIPSYTYRVVTIATVFLIPTACDVFVPDYRDELVVSPNIRYVDPPKSVLFIGNSFTYFNGGIDQHLRELAVGGTRS